MSLVDFCLLLSYSPTVSFSAYCLDKSVAVAEQHQQLTVTLAAAAASGATFRITCRFCIQVSQVDSSPTAAADDGQTCTHFCCLTRWHCPLSFPFLSAHLPHSPLSYLVVICNDCCCILSSTTHMHAQHFGNSEKEKVPLVPSCVAVGGVPFDTCLSLKHQHLHLRFLPLTFNPISAAHYRCPLCAEGESVAKEAKPAF